jgi:hypothetical protein
MSDKPYYGFDKAATSFPGRNGVAPTEHKKDVDNLIEKAQAKLPAKKRKAQAEALEKD